MKAVVTGASGLLGGNLAIELLQQGHEVRATRRGSTVAAHLDGHAIEWVSGELGDATALSSAFRGADVVFHCAAHVNILKQVTPELTSTNVDGTRNVIAAVRHAEVPRLVHCSTVGAVGLSVDGQPSTEEARWNFAELGMDDGYVTTKHMAENLVREAVATGLNAVIVNPSYMLGPYDVRPSSGKLIVDVVRRKVPGWTPGFNNFVDVRDVARGMIQAWHKGQSGQRYILAGENLCYRDVMQRIASLAGVAPPRLRAPRAVSRVVGWFGDLKERRGGQPLLNSVTVKYAYCKTFQFSSAKAQRELGYQTSPSIDNAIRDAIAWFRTRGMLS